MSWRRTWRTCWCDRRHQVQHISFALLISIMLITFMTVAYAAQQSMGEDSLGEHSIIIIDVLAYVVIALFTALVGLVLWNILDMKATIRTNHEEVKKELRKYVKIQVHNAICESQIEVEPE